MDKTIETLLETIADLVNDNDTPWPQKKERIKAAVNADERLMTSFDEFICWFDDWTGEE